LLRARPACGWRVCAVRINKIPLLHGI